MKKKGRKGEQQTRRNGIQKKTGYIVSSRICFVCVRALKFTSNLLVFWHLCFHLHSHAHSCTQHRSISSNRGDFTLYVYFHTSSSCLYPSLSRSRSTERCEWRHNTTIPKHSLNVTYTMSTSSRTHTHARRSRSEFIRDSQRIGRVCMCQSSTTIWWIRKKDERK